MTTPLEILKPRELSEEAFKELLNRVEAEAREVEVPELGIVLTKFRISRRMWHELREKFARSRQISQQMDFIQQLLHSRLFEAAARGTVKLAPALMILSGSAPFGRHYLTIKADPDQDDEGEEASFAF